MTALEPDDVTARITDNDVMVAVSAKINSVTGDAHVQLVQAYDAAYRQNILPHYQSIVDKHTSHTSINLAKSSNNNRRTI